MFERLSSSLILALCLWCGGPAAARAEQAPDWTLPRVGGGTVAFHADARGAPAVLFFWASWCPHCGAALPAMERLYQAYAPRGVHFYALDMWEDGDAVAYFRRHGYHLPLFLAADLVAEDYGIDGTPGIVVTDVEMRIVELELDGAPPATIESVLGDYLRGQLARHAVRAD